MEFGKLPAEKQAELLASFAERKTELTNNTESINRSHEIARTFAEERLGSPVRISRSSGEIIIWQAVRITEEGKVIVKFPDSTGKILEKSVNLGEFQKMNNPESGLALGVTRTHIREQKRVQESAERQGKDALQVLSETYMNASIDSTSRISKAVNELGVGNLSDRQARALLEAHGVKNGNESVFNYGTKSLAEKMKILQNEGTFTKDQAKQLIRQGYAGEAQMHTARMATSKIPCGDRRIQQKPWWPLQKTEW